MYNDKKKIILQSFSAYYIRNAGFCHEIQFFVIVWTLKCVWKDEQFWATNKYLNN